MRHLAARMVGGACILTACGGGAGGSGPNASADAGGNVVSGAIEPDASLSADASAVDARPRPEPSTLCVSYPEGTTRCKSEQGPNPPATGGAIPDGTYALVKVISVIAGSDDDCGLSTLELDRGTYRTTYHDLGGPQVNGGTFEVDAPAHKIVFDRACQSFGGRPSNDGLPRVEQSYSFDAAQKTLTIFTDPIGGWSQPAAVYMLRP